MPDYATSIIALIDGRVDQSRSRVTHFGTVTDRATGSLDPDGANGATVVLDGSPGTTVPVKCFASVLVAGGDRVGLVKFGGDWIIVGNYTGRALADAFTDAGVSGSADNTTTTIIDMPGSPAVTYTKMRDDTIMRFRVALTMQSTTSTAATVPLVGVRVTSADGVTAYDQDVGFYVFTSISRAFFAREREASSAHPAGVYTATGRWRRNSGASTLTINSGDSIQITAREVWP